MMGADLKTTPIQRGTGFKYTLLTKVQSADHTRYEFRFTGTHADELFTFNKVVKVYQYIAA
jgi:hypothetical protein